MNVASSRIAVSRIFWHGTITPRSMTSKLLHWSTTPTMFLPMSCTSPFTVAMTTRPFDALHAVLFLLDERDEMRHGALHHARALHHLRQEHLAGAEQIADDVHAVHQRTFDHGQRPIDRQPRLFGVGDDVVVDARDQRVLQALVDRQVAPLEIRPTLLARLRL